MAEITEEERQALQGIMRAIGTAIFDTVRAAHGGISAPAMLESWDRATDRIIDLIKEDE